MGQRSGLVTILVLPRTPGVGRWWTQWHIYADVTGFWGLQASCFAGERVSSFPLPQDSFLGGGCPSIQTHPLYLGYQASWPALTMTHFLLMKADNSSPGWSCRGLRMGQMPRTVLCSDTSLRTM